MKARDHISQIKSQINEAISEFVPGSKWRLSVNDITGNAIDVLVEFVSMSDQFSSSSSVMVRTPTGQLLEAPKRYLHKIET
jgi:hypothetical protein